MSASTKVELLARRAHLNRTIRDFFDERGFVECETPVRVAAPALEEHVDAIPADGAWLRTSPELHMKRLLAAGAERLYQLGPCFRRGERGRRHRPEFTMLEWYWANVDYRAILNQTRDLVQTVAQALGPVRAYRGEPLRLDGEWEIVTVDDAFRRHAGIAASEALAQGDFDLLLVEKVEPHLGQGRPTFLIDYPAPLGALARRSAANPAIAERWELYIAGIELANAFSELTDPVEQRARFAAAAACRRQDGREVYPLDEAFLAALPTMPDAAGCALGVDRLLMILADAADIADVRLFDE